MPSPETVAPTFSEIVLEHVVNVVCEYRQLVAKAAAGHPLAESDYLDASQLLERLELPEWTFRRDVGAALSMREAESDYRQRELLTMHPHLFAEAHQWVELWHKERTRRRLVLEELRGASERLSCPQ